MPHIAPWFPDARYGIFIHWVLKSIWMADDKRGVAYASDPADPDHPRRLAERFTAANFDARAWGRLFRSWGARYAVLTTKHHIGFSLFDCPESEFNAARHSPAGRDLVAEFCEGMREAGLKVGLYYSLPDWSHPDYASLAGGDDPKKYSREDEPHRWERFLRCMFAEVQHLCSAYGRIDLLWFDGDWERTAEQWRSIELAEMIQKLQPGIVLNNRLRHACLGHYGTPESTAPLGRPGDPWWEFSTTPGDNWDGPEANDNLKPPSQLVRMFADMAAMGGNTLLNVAPAPDGTIPERQLEVMNPLGRWIDVHSEAIHGSSEGLPAGLFNGASTRRGSVLYLIAFDHPRDELVVKGLKTMPESVTHLASGQPLKWRSSGGRPKFNQPGWIFIELPHRFMDDYATVVRLTFPDDTVQVQAPNGRLLMWKGRPALEEQAVAEGR